MSLGVRHLLKSWDRVLTYLCFIGYGVGSFLVPPSSQSQVSPIWGYIFSVELIAAGVLLLISIWNESFWYRITGYVIYAIGMITVAGLSLLLAPQRPGWILILGFAFQGLMSARYVNRDRILNQQFNEVARELRARPQSGD